MNIYRFKERHRESMNCIQYEEHMYGEYMNEECMN